MPSPKTTYDLPSSATRLVVKEEHVEYGFIGKLQNLKYEYRADIRDRAALERNFREKFETLIYRPAEMVEDNKRLFGQILNAFLGGYKFALPTFLISPQLQRRHHERPDPLHHR